MRHLGGTSGFIDAQGSFSSTKPVAKHPYTQSAELSETLLRATTTESKLGPAPDHIILSASVGVLYLQCRAWRNSTALCTIPGTCRFQIRTPRRHPVLAHSRHKSALSQSCPQSKIIRRKLGIRPRPCCDLTVAANDFLRPHESLALINSGRGNDQLAEHDHRL